MQDAHLFFPQHTNELIRRAWQLLTAAASPDSTLLTARRLAGSAALTLSDWGLPEETVAAALLVPMRSYELIEPLTLQEDFGPAALLAERMLAFRSPLMAPSDPMASDPISERHSSMLRRLFRQAYLDLPGFHLVLSILAEHEAHYQVLETSSLAEETQNVFIPLTEMLGLWKIRRVWLERSAKLLAQTNPAAEKNYQYLFDLCGDPAGYTRQAMYDLAANRAEKQLPSDRKRLLNKALGYIHFEDSLLERCRHLKFDDLPNVEPRALEPGTILRRSSDRESQEEMTQRLGVRIQCHTEQDCYRLLGIVHSLGKPIAPKFSERFDDYIAAPQPNGYRALHTALSYKGFKKDALNQEAGGRLVIEVRILTPEMHLLNEMGVATAAHLAPSRYLNVPAWWNGIEQLNKKLLLVTKEHSNIQEFLARNDLKSTSRVIYLFSPRGELLLMEPNSTPLDYAYHIHSDLGYHAGRFTVNGQPAPFNQPLRNGDLVQVHSSPRASGPDLSWLNFVATAEARTKIRRTLLARARAVHPGRVILEEALFQAIQSYETDRKFQLRVAGSQLEIFLERSAADHHLPDVTAVYQRIEARPALANEIIEAVVSDQLLAVVVDDAGQPLNLPADQLVMCGTCRPVPGDPIVGIRHYSRSVLRSVIVHRQNSACAGNTPAARTMPVGWLENPQGHRDDLFWLKVDADDRPRLLSDVLQEIHSLPGSAVLQVEAQAFPNGSAELSIAVQSPGRQHLSQLQRQLEKLNNVRSVWSMPATPVQRLALTALPRTYLPNPYIEREVDEQTDFYDRVEAIEALSGWMAAEGPATWMVLHGQRRVGKSSLARYFTRHILPRVRRSVAVYVSLQNLSGYTPLDLANLLANRIFRELGQEVPPPGPHEAPAPWLERILARASSELDNTPLLIVLDEMDTLFDHLREGDLDTLLFSNLRAVMKRLPNIRWLLILQDSFFHDRSWPAAVSSLLQECCELPLAPLDSTWADKLIREPTEHLGISYENDLIPATIYDLTGGSPFLIKAICYNLVNQAREQGRTTITTHDLAHIQAMLVQEGGRYFNHYIKYLTREGHSLLVSLSQSSPDNDWVPLTRLQEKLNQLLLPLPEQALRRELERLQRQGLVTQDQHSSEPNVRFTVRLFYDWTSNKYEKEFNLRIADDQ